MNSIESQIKEMVRDYVYGNKEVNENSNLIDDLDFDSINYIQLILEIEHNFDLHFDDEMLDYQELIVVGDLIDYIKNKIKK